MEKGQLKVEEKQKSINSYIFYHFGTSGIAVATATAVTHPLDVLKVRLQMCLVGQKGPLTGMGRFWAQMIRSEGPQALYLGLLPALTRSASYGGLRLGLYESSKSVCEQAFGSSNVLLKVASGAFSGAVATALTNPMEVLKVRLQMNPNSGRGGAIKEMQRIISEEGMKALWKGVGAAMTRAAALTASQMATYDESKRHAIFTYLRCSASVYTSRRRSSSSSHLKYHSGDDEYSCDRTNGHDKNPSHDAKGISKHWKLQKWVTLCVQGCAYRRPFGTLQRGFSHIRKIRSTNNNHFPCLREAAGVCRIKGYVRFAFVLIELLKWIFLDHEVLQKLRIITHRKIASVSHCLVRFRLKTYSIQGFVR